MNERSETVNMLIEQLRVESDTFAVGLADSIRMFLYGDGDLFERVDDLKEALHAYDNCVTESFNSELTMLLEIYKIVKKNIK